MQTSIAMEQTPRGVDKIRMYGWTVQDSPGQLEWLPKAALKVASEYQRDEHVLSKILAMAACWSHVACGVLIVGRRNGEFWIIDGQNRWRAAMRRSDIGLLPCIVFDTQSIQAEAEGFLRSNTLRKPVTAIQKHKAQVAAGDTTAEFLRTEIARLGLKVAKNSNRTGEIKCIGWCHKRAGEDKDAFGRVLGLAAALCAKADMHVPEKLLEGLWYLDRNCGEGLQDRRLARRIEAVGARALYDAAMRAAAFYTAGGGRVWAQGMLNEINKGLRYKFTTGDGES